MKGLAIMGLLACGFGCEFAHIGTFFIELTTLALSCGLIPAGLYLSVVAMKRADAAESMDVS